MADETRQLPATGNGGGNKEKELLFLCCTTLGAGFPAGHRPSTSSFFVCWRKFLWRVTIEAYARHVTREDHARHPVCGAGSMIILEDDPYVALLREIVDARCGKDYDRERELMPFVVFPISERKGSTLHVIISGREVTREDIERVALSLVRWEGGDPLRVRCVWKGCDDAWERQYWEERVHSEEIKRLRRGPPLGASLVSPESIARIAKRQGTTSEAVRKQLSDDGFAEDEYGNFVRRNPEFDEGDGETFALILRGYAKHMNYAGPLYLSAHSWEQLLFVAEGQQFVTEFSGKRAWYGYLKDIKHLVCIPVANRFEVAGYTAYTVLGDPDFLPAMDEVSIADSEQVKASLALLEEKEKKNREAGEHAGDEKSGDVTEEPKT
ncbi:MAG: hypothetical protein Q7R85_02230 [bacterium]|nr:hypothetical protein [bacterium]